MDTLRRILWQFRLLILLVLAAGVLLIPAAQAEDSPSVLPDGLLPRLSAGALIPYLMEHPEQAPQGFAQRLQAVEEQATSAQRTPSAAPEAAQALPAGVGIRFNRDDAGLPQTEESITACRSNENIVLGGATDLRGFLEPQTNFTGWYFSKDGGATLANEGLLPTVRMAGQAIPSDGDAVVVADKDCHLYAGSINHDFPDEVPSGIGLYRTTPKQLATCPGGSDPSCWPNRRAVAVGGHKHFLDKEWIYAGPNGSGATVVWVVYTDFLTTGPGEMDFRASIKAVRCRADLSRCTDPIRISGDDRDVQFGDVTIAPNGRVFITWSQIRGEITGTPQTFINKMRTAPPGSTTFGPERIVHVERKAIPFGDSLNANDFSVSTYPKNEVRIVDGKPRVFVVWDACTARALGESICESPLIKLKTSDDLGATWSAAKIISEEGGNYMPTISNDAQGTSIAIAYFTNRYDPQFQNRQDIELVTLDPATTQITNRQRLTPLSNDPEADPIFGGTFFGAFYIEVFASEGEALVHYDANYRQVRLLGEGLPIPQEDNFLLKAGL